MGFNSNGGAPNKPKRLPIQGMMRRKVSGAGLVPVNLPASAKASRLSLHRAFVFMLGVVFIAYCTVMLLLIRGHDRNSFETEGKWGPTVSDSHQAVRNHVQKLADQERRDFGDLQSQQQAKGDPHEMVEINAFGKGKAEELRDLEAFDIHDMQPPEHIRKSKDKEANPVEPNSGAKDPINPQALEATTPRILRAYLEPNNLKDWETKPLPSRTTTADQLTKLEYPRLNSCTRLPELFPIDDFPDEDPFLPWIHDVFPSDDGRFIQFVAQNKRRCRTGTTPEETAALENMQPQIALFQHVPVKRVQEMGTTRYQLVDHLEADPDGMDTRFICRFHPSGQETLSVFNVQYDYIAKRKRFKQTFTKEGTKDNKSIHTSQLIFRCPVPDDLVETVREGTSVVDDWATLFVTLVPIRTPPRYGAPDRFLQPYYQPQHFNNFSVAEEWGSTHMLPLLENSGRWENIPICLPTYKAFPDSTAPPPASKEGSSTVMDLMYPPTGSKKNRLVAATWASSQYATRGERHKITDGARRLNEWIRFHLLVGMDHIYVYDNSNGDDTSLKTVTDQFPTSQVTRIPWPATICNNNKNFDDSPGERSSQYAAESAWRLRFGPHTDWMATMDLDEYMVPVGEYTSLKPFLQELDNNGTKIISFGSWRAWPRRDLIEPPVPIQNKTICDQPHPCFVLKVPESRSILQTYNCDRQLVKKEKMPAEKQIFRTDYVLQHYIHYSTVTVLAQLNAEDTVAAGLKYGRVAPDPLSRFADESKEVTMLHTKSIATQDTAGWQKRCKGEMKGSCRIGVEWPNATIGNLTKDDQGWLYNCYVNKKIDEFWVPKLDKELQKSAVLDTQ